MPIIISPTDFASAIGTETKATDWFQIDQDRINAFADCTLDHQFIHVDPVAAAKSPFGSTIAHGFLSLSMLSYFAEQLEVVIEGVKMGVNYGLDKVRFINPVKVDQRVRARAKLLDVTEKKPGQFQLKLEVTVEIEGQDKPALIAEWLVMQFI
ncbi:MaoC family dehydratase [Microbulbifer hydrolyticus]|uniref:Acyl dehydratase n=1 Tax=Microbulbifer hydrolyticus TaxID=48074 RepID=A0A6P1TBY9_9GAMM|nr:MaoC family dehydratase [Microbulbifer hydrolyticus]MBB5210791.1 acyl dehydratase [Microbulbifer hydrolyticus]QHQ38769.1 MaoC family dehydratase [Microbulbifer hydrolyticus]